jgi:hypothetical protein
VKGFIRSILLFQYLFFGIWKYHTDLIAHVLLSGFDYIIALILNTYLLGLSYKMQVYHLKVNKYIFDVIKKKFRLILIKSVPINMD